MTQQLIGIGVTADDGKGDKLRVAFDKCNENFAELYAASAQGPGAGVTVPPTGTTQDFSNVQNAVNGGGVIYLVPGATYQMGTNTLALNVSGTTLDGGNRGTTLLFANAAADNVRIGNMVGLAGPSNIWIKHLTIQDNATRASGFGVQLFGASQPGLNDVTINVTGAQTALWAHSFNDVVVRDCRLYGQVKVSGTGSEISDVITFDHTLIQPNTRAPGLTWDGAAHTVRTFGLTILNATVGLTISNSAHDATDKNPQYGEFYNLEIDGASQQAVWIQGGVILKFVALECNNNQSTSNSTPTVQIDPDTGFSSTRAIQFIGGYAAQGWGRGMVINAADVEVVGMAIWGTGRGATNTYPALNITGDGKITISSCRFHASGQPQVPSFAIQIDAGAAGPFHLLGNDYQGCGTGEVNDGNVGTTSAAIIVGGVSIVGKPYAPLYSFATLPASPPAGLRAIIFDGVASPTYHQVVSTTGSTIWPVFFNGVNWVYD